MRLIDADAFKKLLNSGGGESVEINISKSMSLGEIVDTVIQAYRKCLFAELEKMPTAHDADKVVEQLEEKVLLIEEQLINACQEDAEAVRLRCKMSGLDEALEIIKAEMCDK